MNSSPVKPIAIGILMGATAYFLPFFLLKGIFFFLAIGALFRLFFFRRIGGSGHGHYMHLVYADHLRNMSEEDYSKYKARFQGRAACGHRQYHPYEDIPKDKK